MPIFDDLKYIITGEEPEIEEAPEIQDESLPDCLFCGGKGLSDRFCPSCGKWDLRDISDLEDEASNLDLI